MENEKKVEYKKYSQYMQGQFREESKKAKALFIGRSYQTLRESLNQFVESKKLRMDTLRWIIKELPAQNDKGEPVPGWQIGIVAYEVGSFDEYTEEDRKRDKELKEAREKAEDYTGDPDMIQ